MQKPQKQKTLWAEYQESLFLMDTKWNAAQNVLNNYTTLYEPQRIFILYQGAIIEWCRQSENSSLTFLNRALNEVKHGQFLDKNYCFPDGQLGFQCIYNTSFVDFLKLMKNVDPKLPEEEIAEFTVEEKKTVAENNAIISKSFKKCFCYIQRANNLIFNQ